MSAPFPEAEPYDDANQSLVAHTHPQDYANPTPSGRYNLVVLGGGTAGLVAAGVAGATGAKVALVESKLLGGDCLVTGCVPSKALLAAAKAAHVTRHAGDFGVATGDVTIDFPAVMQQVRERRAAIAPHDSVERIRDEFNVEVYFGHARFSGRSQVEVEGNAGNRTLDFKSALIATGSKPAVPDIPGLADAGFLTNETLFSLTDLPARLLVIGGGPIGCEMAQAFARLGSRVTLVQRNARLLTKDDADAAQVVREALIRDGVDVRLDAEVTSVSQAQAQLDKGGTIAFDRILVAVGRRPNVDGLGLDAAGVTTNDKGVVTDSMLRTTNHHIYAAGDVAGRWQFTHAADAMGRIVAQNTLYFFRKKVHKLAMPWCTYTDPELAAVTFDGQPASKLADDFKCVRVDLDDVDRTIITGETAGFLKVFHDGGKIRGVVIVGPHAGDLIGEAALAIRMKATLSDLSSTIHPYPTIAEAFRSAGDQHVRKSLRKYGWALRTVNRWRR